MKKIIFIFLCLFMFNIVVKADDTFYLGEKVPNMYVESISGSNFHNGAPFLLHRSDGSIVYCINPFVMMSTTGVYKSYTYNDSIFGLSNEQLNKMNIIAYYGYGYKSHTDIKWFGITQYLLWKNMGYDDVYFTDVYYGSRVERYTGEVNELQSLVNNYYVLPSFSNKSYEYNPSSRYEIIDSNNVLSNYQIKESNIDASINNNKLVINTKGSGNYKITFVKKSPVTRNYILYNLSGAQSLFYPGKINDITFSISIKVNSGSITINKYDSENKKRLEASLTGSKFGIYKNNSLVSELTINSSGTTSISNLPLGSYTVKELNSSKGYTKDPKVYSITITKENKDIVINSYSKIIEGNLIINKYYGSNNDYKLDESSVFEIYNNGNLIKTVSGRVNEKLEYGTYLIKQVNGKKYYDLISNFNVSVLEEKDYKYDFYTEKTDEIKAYEELLNKREESLNKKQQDLIELENKINEKENDLINLKNEIYNQEQVLNKKQEEINKKEEDLLNLESDLERENNELQIIKEEIKKDYNLLEEKSEYLKQLEEELSELNEKLITKEDNLIDLENLISIKVIEINKLKEELDVLGNQLKEKENNLILLEKKLNNKQSEIDKSIKELALLTSDLKQKEQNLLKKEIDLKEKEQEIIKLSNRKEEVLIVKVPNTSKRNYNKLISKLLILLGCLIIISTKKKTTNC